MSGSKKYTYKGLPGFDIDQETGRYFPVAVNFKAVFGSPSTRGPSNNSNALRRFRATPSSPPVKFRKVEPGVRKELFKIPVINEPIKTEIRESKRRTMGIGVRRSLVKILPSTSGINKDTKSSLKKKKITPLKTITEQSENRLSVLEETRYQQVVTPQLGFANNIETKENIRTPDSQEPITDFLKFEELCKTPQIPNESPLTSVCNSFKSKMLLGNSDEVGPTVMSQKEIITEIKRIAKHNQELSEETLRKMNENNSKIMALVEKLEETNQSNTETEENDQKENAGRRRSLRLRNKSPSPSKPTSGSPVILRPGDLRKSALNKSLVNKCQKYQMENTRIQKAMDLYNSTRTTCSALLTPKISRGQQQSTSGSPRDVLSRKIQQQCLMLQDTPRYK